MRNEPWIHTWGSYEISTTELSFPEFGVNSLTKKYNPLKDFQSDLIERSSR